MEQGYSMGGLEAQGLTFEPAGALSGTDFVQDPTRFEEFPAHDPVREGGGVRCFYLRVLWGGGYAARSCV